MTNMQEEQKHSAEATIGNENEPPQERPNDADDAAKAAVEDGAAAGGNDDAAEQSGADNVSAADHASSSESDAPADGQADSNAEEQSRQLEELRRQVEELQQRLLRVQADYDNFRRRTRLEKEDMAKYAASDLIGKLLPVLDNFDRAVASGQTGNDYGALYKGIEMIHRQFRQVLEQEGLSAMDAVGQAFNPEYHNAVMKVEDGEHEEGIVLEELQKGYMFKDKVLRPAMVKVSG
jgi:molecular chaperone GrpE